MSATATLLRAIQTRLALDDAELADYLGVPRSTLRHWLDGTRYPGAATTRLIHVMGMIEAIAPDVHQVIVDSSVSVGLTDPADSDLTVDRLLADETDDNT